MKIFVAGATGVLGRRVVPALAAAGHAVTGVARSKKRAALLQQQGAEPVAVDLFDPIGVKMAVESHEVVINLATKIPPPSRAVLRNAWSENSRIRSEVSRNLVDASLESDVGRFVQESIAFIYPDCGDRWIDEDAALDPPELGRPSEEAEAQAARFTDAGRIGVVLRFGQLYAPEAAHTMFMCRMARLRLPPLPGPKDAYAASLSAEDAAHAVLVSERKLSARLSRDGDSLSVWS